MSVGSGRMVAFQIFRVDPIPESLGAEIDAADFIVALRVVRRPAPDGVPKVSR